MAFAVTALLSPWNAWAQADASAALSFEATSEKLEFEPDDIWAVEVRRGAPPEGVNLEITLNGDAKDRFARFTAIHVAQPTAVYIGGDYVMDVIIQTPITGGRMAIAFPDQPSASEAMDRLLGR